MQKQTALQPILRLLPAVKTYEWGSTRPHSAARTFAAAAGGVPPDVPVAEVWFGDHPAGPLRLPGDGGGGARLFEARPYLFKILDVDKALSIQFHPGRAEAARLHARDPAHYPDASDKPEMLVALTAFEAFAGFRPVEEILWSEAGEFLEDCDGDLGAMVRAFLDADDQSYEALRAAATAAGHPLMDRLHRQYPMDRGVLIACFLMHHVTLRPGECLVLRDHEVHAYLRGEGLELMRPSDNVVRLGLTPKFKDRDAFFEMAHLESTAAPRVLRDNSGGGVYRHPDMPDCFMRLLDIKPHQAGVPVFQPGSLVVVLRGFGRIETPDGRCTAIVAGDTLHCQTPVCLRGDLGAVVVVVVSCR
jgi:mannose-6-phosphate isomerase